MGNGTPRVNKSKSRLGRSEQPKIIESLGGSFFKQLDPRMKQRIVDSRMIQEDQNATANLSPEFINREFNPNRFAEALGRRCEDSEV